MGSKKAEYKKQKPVIFTLMKHKTTKTKGKFVYFTKLKKKYFTYMYLFRAFDKTALMPVYTLKFLFNSLGELKSFCIDLLRNGFVAGVTLPTSTVPSQY